MWEINLEKHCFFTTVHITLSCADIHNKVQMYTINRYMQSEKKCKFGVKDYILNKSSGS